MKRCNVKKAKGKKFVAALSKVQDDKTRKRKTEL